MVKKIDDLRPDHIGWRLWEAAALWKRLFADEMVAAGHGWYREARSSIIPYIDLEAGARQVDIVAAMGLSKQAVQQLIQDLEAEGIVERVPDPDDGRGKIVRLMEKGLAAQIDSAAAKRKVEATLRDRLGAAEFDSLSQTLIKLIETDDTA